MSSSNGGQRTSRGLTRSYGRTEAGGRQLTRKAALIAAVAACLTLAAGGAAMASGARRPALQGRQAGAQAMSAAAAMRAQIPLIRAVDQIRGAATGARSGYTNITVSVPQDLVTVYWRGAVPGRIARLLAGLRSAKVAIQVRRAPYSAAQLDAQVRRMEASRASYAARGILLDSFAVRNDGTGIEVGVVQTRLARPGALASLRAGLLAGSAIPLAFGAAPRFTPTHRLEDFPPHWAGSRIVEGNGNSSCTTGFPMQRRSDGRTFITTADHCDANVGHPVNEQWWDWFGAHDTSHRIGEAWYHTAGLDVAYIRPPNGAVSGLTYDGGVAESHDFAKNVVGVAGNVSGVLVCTSGAWTGVHCNINTDYERSFFIPEDNSYVPLWVGHQINGGIAGGEGDSGGPVFSLGSQSGTVIAKGSISGGIGSQFNCTNDNGEQDVCGNQVGWVDEQSILNSLGANILTS